MAGGAKISGGANFEKGNVSITPLVSLFYNHLDLESYTETGAGALNLSVDNEDSALSPCVMVIA